MNPSPRPANRSHRAASGDGAGFGRFERASSPPPMSEINMTPLIDVMLVLLVIFIITAPLMVSAIKVRLPEAATNTPAQALQAVPIAIDAQGRLFLRDAPTDEAALQAALQEAARKSPDTEVQLRADASVPYGRVVQVMGLAHRAGLQRIGFVAQPTP